MATAIKKYPVPYQDIARAGFNWQKMRGNNAMEIILWHRESSNEFMVTVRSQDGRVQRFVPESDGTLSIVKPEPQRSAFTDLMFAANHGAEIAWSSEMEDEGLNVVAVAGVTAEDEEDQIEQRYGA